MHQRFSVYLTRFLQYYSPISYSVMALACCGSEQYGSPRFWLGQVSIIGIWQLMFSFWKYPDLQWDKITFGLWKRHARNCFKMVNKCAVLRWRDIAWVRQRLEKQCNCARSSSKVEQTDGRKFWLEARCSLERQFYDMPKLPYDIDGWNIQPAVHDISGWMHASKNKARLFILPY